MLLLILIFGARLPSPYQQKQNRNKNVQHYRNKTHNFPLQVDHYFLDPPQLFNAFGDKPVRSLIQI